MLYIVGLGPGHRDYILPIAHKTLEKSQVVLGFQRALDSLDIDFNKKVIIKSLSEALEFIRSNEGKDIALVASGDPCFYGISDYIRKNYVGDTSIISGISSFQYLCSKLCKMWQGAYLSSLHGREEDFINKVRSNELSIWLTDKKNSPKAICERLYAENIVARVYVGENLSYEDERISIGTAKELMERNFSDLSVVIVDRG